MPNSILHWDRQVLSYLDSHMSGAAMSYWSGIAAAKAEATEATRISETTHSVLLRRLYGAFDDFIIFESLMMNEGFECQGTVLSGAGNGEQ